MITQLLARYQAVCGRSGVAAEAAGMTVVFDAGQNSEANFAHLAAAGRSEEHTSELQSQSNLVCRLLLEKKNTDRHQRLHPLPRWTSDPHLENRPGARHRPRRLQRPPEPVRYTGAVYAPAHLLHLRSLLP